jgi:hypothetical protein
LEHQYGNDIEIVTHVDHESLFKDIDATPEGIQSFGILENGKAYKATFLNPTSGLCVGQYSSFSDTGKQRVDLRRLIIFTELMKVINIAQSEISASSNFSLFKKKRILQRIIKEWSPSKKDFFDG